MESKLVIRRSLNLLSHSPRSIPSPCCPACFIPLRSNISRITPQKARTLRFKHDISTRPPGVRPNKSAISKSSPLPTSPEPRAVARLKELLNDSLKILSAPQAPSEAEVLESLSTCADLARYFRGIKDAPAVSTIKPDNAAANLLFLDTSSHDSPPSNSNTTPTSPIALGNMASSIADEAIDNIAATVLRIAEATPIFLTPAILNQIVHIQSLLHRPESLARIFTLYANKPIPTPSTSPIKYNPAAPNKIAAAIPLSTAHAALDAAISARNLPLSLDIIEASVCTPAFKRAKLLQRAAIPAAGAAVAPLAAYTLAAQFSTFQDTMAGPYATAIGTAGILAYLGATGSMGFIALTTANDQMERVTWASGTPLRERWIREEERALLDKVAASWGFKDVLRRGEEESPEWDALKELIGIRGMVLDRVELMEGME